MRHVYMNASLSLRKPGMSLLCDLAPCGAGALPYWDEHRAEAAGTPDLRPYDRIDVVYHWQVQIGTYYREPSLNQLELVPKGGERSMHEKYARVAPCSKA